MHSKLLPFKPDVCVCVFASFQTMFIVVPAQWNFDQSEDSLFARDLY